MAAPTQPLHPRPRSRSAWHGSPGHGRPRPWRPRPWRPWLLLALPALLAACAGQPAYRTAADYARSSRTYTAPGPPEDPWGPYIREASGRFGVPEQWVRAVMHQESGGHAFQGGRPITSSAGAMGLMQVMPATYSDLRDQFGLGEDPYDPHNSILAGTAYIRQMYDRYGAPGFLAAYNAGPQRLDDYLAGNSSLPNETVNYLASITPHLGRERPLSGPLAAYADASQPVADRPAALPAVARGGTLRPAGALRLAGAGARGACVPDPDAAYDAPCGTPARPPQPEVLAAATPLAAAGCVRDPDAAYDSPCRPASPAAVAQPVMAAFRPQSAPGCVRDPDAAYDAPCAAPARPVTALWQPPAAPVAPVAVAVPGTAAPFQPQLQPARPAAVVPRLVALAPSAAGGAWAVQVGAFASPAQARQVAEAARRDGGAALGAGRPTVGSTTPFGRNVLYRARLVGLSFEQAAEGCSALQRRGVQCMTVAPGG